MDIQGLKKKLEEILDSKKEDLYKKIAVAAVLTKALEELEVKPIIVGGQAVEFYTSGGYTTMDIDIICERSIKEIDEKLKKIGFKKVGKYWTLNNSDIAIEVPSGPLAGSREKIVEIEIEDNLKAYLIGIEDIIIDRLNSYKFWNIYSDKEWIIAMIFVNYENIDWDYLEQRSIKEGTKLELKKFKKIAEKKLEEIK